MKKLLIASLIATSALSAVADETTLYGAIGYHTAITKNNADSVSSSIKGNRWNLDTKDILWGVKGEENISDNLNAFWKMEFGENGATRYAYMGLKGDSWGTFTLGTQDSLFKVVTNYPDIFQASFWGSTTKYDEQLDRPDRVISYVSPNWSGFQFGLAGILNGKDRQITDGGLGLKTGADFTKSKAFGAGQIGLWYNNYGFYAGLAYQYVASNFGLVSDLGTVYSQGETKNSHLPYRGKGGTELIGVAVGYKNDNFKVGLSEQHKAGDGDKAALAGEYYYGPHTFRAGFGYAKSEELNAAVGINNSNVNAPAWTAKTYLDANGDVASYDNRFNEAKAFCAGNKYCSNKVYTYGLEYQYNLSKRTYTWIGANYIDWNAKGISNGYNVKVGLKHEF